MEKLKRFIKKHDKLYVISRLLYSLNDANLLKLLKGFYDGDSDFLLLIVNRAQYFYHGKNPIYIIDYGCNNRCTMGFAAMLRGTLLSLELSEFLSYKPVVIWGKNTKYYDEEMTECSRNVFTYYFQPVSDIQIVKENIPYILSSESHFEKVHKMDDYRMTGNDVVCFANLYKKYIHFNDRTNTYITEQLKKIMVADKILGIHVRGTDFALGFKNHPQKISIEEFKSKAREIKQAGGYAKVFLATEDQNALDAFRDEFGADLLYYEDVFRTSGNTGPHNTFDNRQFHKYKLGLEVLRDIYTLANCNGFICGMSQVSFAARYINRALERKFDDFVLIDRGVHQSGVVVPGQVKLKEK